MFIILSVAGDEKQGDIAVSNQYFETELKLERNSRSIPDEDVKKQESLYYKEMNQYKHEINDGLQVEEEGLEQYQKLKEMNTIKMKKSKQTKHENATNENVHKMTILTDEKQIQSIKNLYFNILKPFRLLENIGHIMINNKETGKDFDMNHLNKDVNEVKDESRVINVKVSDEMQAASNNMILSEHTKYNVENSTLSNDKEQVISQAHTNDKTKIHNELSNENLKPTEAVDDVDPAIKITDAFLTHIRHGRKHKHLYNDTDIPPSYSYLNEYNTRKISPKFDQKFENFRKELSDEKSSKVTTNKPNFNSDDKANEDALKHISEESSNSNAQSSAANDGKPNMKKVLVSSNNVTSDERFIT